MKATLLIWLGVMSSGLSAQNWALLNPAYKYNYSNDGSDTISNQIFVTHIDTLGVDSFRYDLNRIGSLCVGCAPGLSSQCWFGPPQVDLVLSDQPQGLGLSLQRHGSSWSILRSLDTLVIETLGSLGSSWTGPGSIDGTIYDVSTMLMFGVLDSIKRVAFTSGDSVVISKEHGVVKISQNGLTRSDLIGVDGTVQLGRHFPTVIDLFDYQPGDVLQYYDESEFQSSFCVHFGDRITKYKVIQRNDFVDSTIYTLQETFSYSEVSYYPLQWTPCGNTHYSGQDTITVRIDHDSLDDGNTFHSGLRGPLYPGLLAPSFQMPVSNGLSTWIMAHIDTSGSIVIEPHVVSAFGWNSTLYCSSDQSIDSLFPNSDGLYQFKYKEGVGLVFQDFYSFESGHRRSLMGYSLNGNQWGNLHSDSQILSIRDLQDERLVVAVHPNPANAQLMVTTSRPGPSQWSVLDAAGRTLLQGTSTQSPFTISTGILSSGAYILRLLNQGSPAAKHFIIAR